MRQPAAIRARTAGRRLDAGLQRLDGRGVALLSGYQAHRDAVEPYVRAGAAVAAVLTLLLDRSGTDPEQPRLHGAAQPRERPRRPPSATRTEPGRTGPTTSPTPTTTRTGALP